MLTHCWSSDKKYRVLLSVGHTAVHTYMCMGLFTHHIVRISKTKAGLVRRTNTLIEDDTLLVVLLLELGPIKGRGRLVAEDCIELSHDFGSETVDICECADVLVDLVNGGSPEDDCANVVVLDTPCNSKLSNRTPNLVRDC